MSPHRPGQCPPPGLCRASPVAGLHFLQATVPPVDRTAPSLPRGEPYAPSSRLRTGTFNSGRTGASPCTFHTERVSDVRPLVAYAETGLQLEAVGTVEAVLPKGQGLSYRQGLGEGRDGPGDGTAGCGRRASLGDHAMGTQPWAERMDLLLENQPWRHVASAQAQCV